MDMSHLPAAIAADCDKTGNFAKDVWACRREGATIDFVMEMVVNFKSNNTSLLEELVHELYAMPIDSSANIYNVGFNKLYKALDLTDADNPRFTGGEKGIPKQHYTYDTNRKDRRARKAQLRKIAKRDAKKGANNAKK